MVSKTIQIKAPLQTVYNCVVDFESYPKFLSDVKSAKVIAASEEQMEVAFKLNLIKEINYTLLIDLDPPHGVVWKLKTGEMMRSNNGSWKLKMLSDDLTEADYAIDVEFGFWIPKAITQTLIEKSLPQTLNRFKKKAEKMVKR